MDKGSPPLGICIFAGGLAGASETLVTYPAEFVKVRRQLEKSNIHGKPTNSFTVIRSTILEQGVRGVYAGCQTLALSNALKSGVRFFSFDTAKRLLTRRDNSTSATGNNPWINVCAGLCAGVIESVLVVTPGEALKTRVIHDTSSGGQLRRLSVMQLVNQTVRQDGILSLWRGLTPVLCKQGTNSAVRFATFAALKDKLSNTWPSAINGTTATILAGAGSGVVTVYASMPFDNVKTRMQGISDTRRGMFPTAKDMLANEGIHSFWKATTPRLVRLTLSSTITFMVYDQCILLFDLLSPRRHILSPKPIELHDSEIYD